MPRNSLSLYRLYAVFSREAGSAGRDTRGIIRVHEFDKVEMVKFARPEDSMNQLESMVAEAELCLQRLGLPYHVVMLCTGDLGFSACKCYDIEVWLPSYNNYKEISSCSNCRIFRREGQIFAIKTRQRSGNTLCAYTERVWVGGGRTMAAIMENYQNADGTIYHSRCPASLYGWHLVHPARDVMWMEVRRSINWHHGRKQVITRLYFRRVCPPHGHSD